jgi:hypothetical protein
LRNAIQNTLPHVRTDLDRFSIAEMQTLMLHGRNVAVEQLVQKFDLDMQLKDLDWDTTQTNPDKLIKTLRKSAFRKWRVFSFTDWISGLQLIIVALVILASVTPIAHLINALARANDANQTATKAANEADNNVRIIKQELAATANLVNALQAQNNRSQQRTCRVPSNGIESYGSTQVVTLTSPRMGGGHSQPEWCNQAIQSLRPAHPQDAQFTVVSSSENSHSTCVIRIDSQPVYKEAPSPECK